MNNEPIKGDRRTRKTKKAIKEAFISLLSKNDTSKISVTDISDLADINRKTFYAHYDDVSAVMDELENELVNQFMNLMGDYDIAKFISNPYPVFKQLTKVVDENIDFYDHLFKDGASGTILEKVKKIINEKLTIQLSENSKLDSFLINYTVGYFTGGLISAFEIWFNSENNISLEELSNHLGMITTGGLKAVSAGV